MTTYQKLGYFQRWALRPCTCQRATPCLHCEAVTTLLDLQRLIHQRYTDLAACPEAIPQNPPEESTHAQ